MYIKSTLDDSQIEYGSFSWFEADPGPFPQVTVTQASKKLVMTDDMSSLQSPCNPAGLVLKVRVPRLV